MMLLFLASATADDIRDIRGPIHLTPWWVWVLLILGIVLLLMAATWLIRRWLRRSPPVKIPLPHEIALKRLAEAHRLMEPGKVREYSIEVSDAIRGYIELRFGLAASHRTTEEFLGDLLKGSTSPLSSHAEFLKDFLQHCDMAKFARGSLAPDQMQAMHESAQRLVKETIPHPDTRASLKKTERSLKHVAVP